MDWDTRTLEERLEELRRPTVFQDPLDEEIRTYWAAAFAAAAGVQADPPN